MTVGELIEELKKLPQDLDVSIPSDTGGYFSPWRALVVDADEHMRTATAQKQTVVID